MNDRDILFALERMNKAYARCLDDDRLEHWPDFFVEEGRYIIQPRENAEAGLYGYLMYFENKAMIRDRVTSLRKANYYNIHTDRHIISNVDMIAEHEQEVEARANYCVIQTDVEGNSEIFSVGEYRDKVVFTDGQAKLKQRLVIADTANVKGLLAVPL